MSHSLCGAYHKTRLPALHACNHGYHTWENFGGEKCKFGEWYTIRQIFLAKIYKYSGITDRLPADSPKFSSLVASAVMIC